MPATTRSEARPAVRDRPRSPPRAPAPEFTARYPDGKESRHAHGYLNRNPRG
jgi:hypothetical protein